MLRKKIIQVSWFVALMALSVAGFAQVKVVVIPLSGETVVSPYADIITVGPSGADFTHPNDAIASISESTPQEDNRILIKIAAGEYTMTSPLVMRRYVDIEGAGTDENSGTILTGARPTPDTFASDASIVVGEDDAELRDMKLINTGGNCFVVGMYNSNSSPTVRNVDIQVSDSTCDTAGNSLTYGVFNERIFTFPRFYDVVSHASGIDGGSSFGINNSGGAASFAKDSHFSSGSVGGKSVFVDGVTNLPAVASFQGGSLPNGVGLNDTSIVRCVDVSDPGSFIGILLGNCMSGGVGGGF